ASTAALGREPSCASVSRQALPGGTGSWLTTEQVPPEPPEGRCWGTTEADPGRPVVGPRGGGGATPSPSTPRLVALHAYGPTTSGPHRARWLHSQTAAAPVVAHRGRVGRRPDLEGQRPMRTIVSGQHAASPEEFAELALGIDTELFTGPADGETPEERAARLDAAADILADLWRTDPELAAYASRLLAPGS